MKVRLTVVGDQEEFAEWLGFFNWPELKAQHVLPEDFNDKTPKGPSTEVLLARALRGVGVMMYLEIATETQCGFMRRELEKSTTK